MALLPFESDKLDTLTPAEGRLRLEIKHDDAGRVRLHRRNEVPVPSLDVFRVWRVDVEVLFRLKFHVQDCKAEEIEGRRRQSAWNPKTRRNHLKPTSIEPLVPRPHEPAGMKHIHG